MWGGFDWGNESEEPPQRGSVHAKLLWSCLTLCDPKDCCPRSMGFSRQEHCRGLPCPPPGDLPDPGVEPAFLTSSALAGGYFTTSTTWEAPERMWEQIRALGSPDLQASWAEVMGDLGTHSSQLASEAGDRPAELSP